MNESYKRDVEALRLLHRDWDEKTKGDQQAIHHTFMYTISAAVEAGVVAFPDKADGEGESS